MSQFGVPPGEPSLREEDVQGMLAPLREGWLTMGPRTARLETELADWSGSPLAVTVSSGAAALHLSCLAAGVGPGDEVIVPALAGPWVADAARLCGATPVLCDVHGPNRPTLDPADVGRLITDRTRAVIVTHLLGIPADAVALRELCDERELVLIEDATAALGAVAAVDGRLAGTVGHLGCLSLAGIQLGLGEGGAVLSADDRLAAKVKLLRSHAMTSGTWDRHRGHEDSYDIVDIGFNFRLDEPRSALALARLPQTDALVTARRALMRELRDALGAREDVTLVSDATFDGRSAPSGLALLAPDGPGRDALRLRFAEAGVATARHPALHTLTAYRPLSAGGGLPGAEAFDERAVVLGIEPLPDPARIGAIVAG